ncbi:hypothetical protein GKC56_03890 [Neisseriaceae bacterium PsAf]|nr:hypothetical protein [Neisseriaceae bacterium PsAf]
MKKELRNYLELSFIPKQWRFVEKIPVNSVNKINWQQVNALFAHPAKMPLYEIITYHDKEINLRLFFNEELIYFKGHFPDNPIFPGVAQLAVSLQLGRDLFSLKQIVERVEKIKFAKVIQPYEIVVMNMQLKDNKKLLFKMNNLEEELVSSGTFILK